MPFVVDASVTASWLLPDEADPRADAAYDRLDHDDVLAPGLWWFETRNIFVMNERRGRIAGDDARRAFAFLSRCRSSWTASLTNRLCCPSRAVTG